MLVKGIARSIFVEIVERQDAQICQIITVIFLVKNFAKENYKLEFVAKVERLSQGKIFVILMALQVFQKFTSNAVFVTIIFVDFFVARTIFVPHVAVNAN